MLNSLLQPFQIGDIYISLTETNPASRFGGTWELFASGKTLVCINPSDTDFNVAGKTGGFKTHTLTTEEMPKHRHNFLYGKQQIGNLGSGQWGIELIAGAMPESISETGGSKAHNNLQPYVVVYMYEKTA